MDKYIKKLTAKYGSFIFPECKTHFDPFREEEQLEQMIPNYRSHANALINKKSTSNSDLTYKIVKTADNHLSIFKKNDKSIQSIQAADGVQEKSEKSDKAQHVEHKHGKNSSTTTTEAADDLKYQVMKRDKETSRVDGRVDSVILKRKAESPSPPNDSVGENRKKMKLLTNYRRMSTPTLGKEFSNVESLKNAAKTPNDRPTTVPKANDEQSKIEMKNRIDRQSSSKSKETPPKDVATKSNLKEDLISTVVKNLDKLQAFVSTNDICKGKNLETQPTKMAEQELCNKSGSSNDTADKPQRNKSNNLDQAVVATNLDKSKTDEDENLLVPMQDHPEMTDSKKELQLASITSSRQGSMSGSSIKSATGSLDDAYEMSIKTEPLSGDEMDSSTPNDDNSERIMSPLDNRSQNGSLDSNLSKISVKNISLMTRPLEQMQRPQIGYCRAPTPLNKSSKCL